MFVIAKAKLAVVGEDRKLNGSNVDLRLGLPWLGVSRTKTDYYAEYHCFFKTRNLGWLAYTLLYIGILQMP